MGFKRNVDTYLNQWKKSESRKPLIIRGARQVGKTTLMSDFAKNYKYPITLNLEKPNDRRYFEDFDDVNTIVEALLLSNEISSLAFGDTLLFIDEIQESPKAILLQISLLH